MNISLPPEMLLELQKEAKAEKFSSLSEYVRSLIRERKQNKLLRELEEDRKQFAAGNYKVLKSFKDLN